jgi:glycerol-3-phosphate dehydrogenase
MSSPQRVLMEILRWACAYGATAVNYIEAKELIVAGGKLAGVKAVERLTGDNWEFSAPVVVNCAGPWSREFAVQAGSDQDSLFHPSLAINVLLEVEPHSAAALAVAPAGRGEPVYFMYPYRGKVLAGTLHRPWTKEGYEAHADEALIHEFLEDLNAAVPGLGAKSDRVIRVFAGLLPTTHDGGHKLTKRPVMIDHEAIGGPKGFLSISGIKLTTARLVAERSLRLLERKGYLPTGAVRSLARVPSNYGLDLIAPEEVLGADGGRVRAAVEQVVREEAVVSVDDLVLRRTAWGDEPSVAERVSRRLLELLPEAFREPVGAALAGQR